MLLRSKLFSVAMINTMTKGTFGEETIFVSVTLSGQNPLVMKARATIKSRKLKLT